MSRISFCISFLLLTGEIWLAVTDIKVLMVMKKGDGSDVERFWYTEGGVNETSPNMSDWSVRDLLSYGAFRSSVVDLWPYANPEKVNVEAMNSNGNILWWATFRTNGTNSNLGSWMQPTHLLTSSSQDMMETSNRGIYHGVPNTEMLFALATNRNHSWFYIDQSEQVRPKFFMTRNNTSPQDRFPPSDGSQWWNDYIFEMLSKQQLIQLDLSTYSDTGNSYVFLTRQVVGVSKLLSFSSLLYNIYFSMSPCSNDWGDPYLDQTGQTKDFTTKLLTYDIETIPVYCLTIDILEPIPSSYSVSFTGKTTGESFIEAQALVVTGYWPNGTFPIEISPSTTVGMTTELSSTSSTVETTVGQTTEISSTSSTVETTIDQTTEITSTSSNVDTTVGITTEVTSASSNVETTIGQTDESSSAPTTTVIGTTTTHQVITTSASSSASSAESATSKSNAVTTQESTSGNTVEGQCFCVCLEKINSTVLSAHELQAKLIQLRNELTVNYKTLSSYIRKLNSMPDSRKSAQGLGIMGVTVIALFLFSLVFLDLQFLVKTAKTVKYSLKGKRLSSI